MEGIRKICRPTEKSILQCELIAKTHKETYQLLFNVFRNEGIVIDWFNHTLKNEIVYAYWKL